MPRDLQALADQQAVQSMGGITESPDVMTEHERHQDHTRLKPAIDSIYSDSDDLNQDAKMLEDQLALKESQQASKRDELHPYTQTLTITDIPSCQRVEDATFPPQERCTEAKFRYRLTTCPELSLGIFTSHDQDNIETAATSVPVYSGAPERKAVLLGHIIATRSSGGTVVDADMALPQPGEKGGHDESGRTICIHSLAVLPDYQGRGLGRTLMLAYIQRMEQQNLADRLALIAHDHLIPFYESLGFTNLGESQCQYGGGAWYDLIRELGESG